MKPNRAALCVVGNSTGKLLFKLQLYQRYATFLTISPAVDLQDAKRRGRKPKNNPGCRRLPIDYQKTA